jgi:hypothetical protein
MYNVEVWTDLVPSKGLPSASNMAPVAAFSCGQRQNGKRHEFTPSILLSGH